MKSTSTQPCLAKGTPQMDWLTKDLAAVDRSVTPWVVVNFHQPYMNSNEAHSIAIEGVPMQEAIEDTLYQYKVDLVRKIKLSVLLLCFPFSSRKLSL